MLNRILKNGNVFVNGSTLMGNFEEITIPAITEKSETFTPSFADIDVRMGLEALKGELTLTDMNPKVFGLVGLRMNKYLPIRILGALEDEMDGKIVQVEINLQARLTNLEDISFKNGEKATFKVSYSCVYMKQRIGNDVVQEMDLQNHVWRINGEDQWQAIRDALELD